MFNGIIEVVGVVRAIDRGENNAIRLRIDAGVYAPRLKLGDSIAVDGICLTVVRRKAKEIALDITPETWERTNLRARRVGDRLNLEMPITGNTLLSGHFVQGHVEGVGEFLPWKRKGEDIRLRLRIPKELAQYCIPKGSIALNGVSLTIATLRDRTVEVALIPYTLQHTNLGDLGEGDAINVETDMLGRYVVSLVKKSYHKLSRGR